MKKIGIVGQGFVGTAVYETMRLSYDVQTFDTVKESTCGSLEELCEQVSEVFLCLPTPMKKTGECDLSIIENVVRNIDNYGKSKIIIIKSTIPPGTTEKLNKKCKNIQIVFNPEFLTEANYIDDFKNQNRIIIGGPRPASTKVKNLFKKVFQNTPIIKTGSTTAEMVKYFANCFLATKVSFANEMKQFCDQKNIDYDKVVEYALYDNRIGSSHLGVPGPDGQLGFGGSCFPKDINALIQEMKKEDINARLLKAVWDKNLEVRPERDWEQLKGRAVSE
tara:strand:+ start:9983 stop:10813 length:831 start_codon:yes stop_codon:yes gene_type:complete